MLPNNIFIKNNFVTFLITIFLITIFFIINILEIENVHTSTFWKIKMSMHQHFGVLYH